MKILNFIGKNNKNRYCVSPNINNKLNFKKIYELTEIGIFFRCLLSAFSVLVVCIAPVHTGKRAIYMPTSKPRFYQFVAQKCAAAGCCCTISGMSFDRKLLVCGLCYIVRIADYMDFAEDADYPALVYTRTQEVYRQQIGIRVYMYTCIHVYLHTRMQVYM